MSHANIDFSDTQIYSYLKSEKPPHPTDLTRLYDLYLSSLAFQQPSHDGFPSFLFQSAHLPLINDYRFSHRQVYAEG